MRVAKSRCSSLRTTAPTTAPTLNHIASKAARLLIMRPTVHPYPRAILHLFAESKRAYAIFNIIRIITRSPQRRASIPERSRYILFIRYLLLMRSIHQSDALHMTDALRVSSPHLASGGRRLYTQLPKTEDEAWRMKNVLSQYGYYNGKGYNSTRNLLSDESDESEESEESEESDEYIKFLNACEKGCINFVKMKLMAKKSSREAELDLATGSPSEISRNLYNQSPAVSSTFADQVQGRSTRPRLLRHCELGRLLSTSTGVICTSYYHCNSSVGRQRDHCVRPHSNDVHCCTRPHLAPTANQRPAKQVKSSLGRQPEHIGSRPRARVDENSRVFTYKSNFSTVNLVKLQILASSFHHLSHFLTFRTSDSAARWRGATKKSCLQEERSSSEY
ncbi:unnamed protein product [Trichogramma brassicae]|uniref:Uncharacterized protein n=1 Tax=Trichogramma brassicae TaxID=86971 RepID=A0A6H5IQ10_9HYME|nr:unnamed protein product [Trichogramma brassicae]